MLPTIAPNRFVFSAFMDGFRGCVHKVCDFICDATALCLRFAILVARGLC
jgi:hypothetical protein